jgi:hypothetical protein
MKSIKSSKGLASILNKKRNSNLKTNLGYEEGSSSGQPSNKESIKFVKSTETKEENQPPRRSEGKTTRIESEKQRNNILSAQ